MESWPFLLSLGVPLKSLNLPIIDTLHISAPNGNCLSHKLPLGGFGISRFKLDNILFQLAVEAGVNVQTNCTVMDIEKHQIKTSKGIFSATQCLGSWGKRSKLDTSLSRNFLQPKNRKLNNYVGVKYHVKGNLPDNAIALHNFENGYCGISKIEDGLYCLCYLVQGNELKKAHGNIKKMEENLLMKNPFLKKYFTEFPSTYQKPLSISQISFEPKTQQEQGIPLIGDAAGLIAPLCGNGMSMALHASAILAKQIELVQTEKKPFELAMLSYEKEWKLQFSKRLKIGRIIQSLFGNTILTNLLISTLKPFPKLINALVKQTHGKPF
jgi:flavin-dependent dehydrogenase